MDNSLSLQRICKTASKSILNKWSLHSPPMAVYSRDSGFYLGTLLPYEILKEDIIDAIIDKTAKLKSAISNSLKKNWYIRSKFFR